MAGQSESRAARSTEAVPRSTSRAALGWISWTILLTGLVLAFAIRIRLSDVPLERDEGEYGYAGQLVLQGVPPYVEMNNMKLPGVYYAYALFLAVFGESAKAIRFGLALWTTASAGFLFVLGRRLFGPLGGAAAAVTFATLSVSPAVLGPAAHATHFVVLPAVAGTLLLWSPPWRRDSLRAALAGLLFGIALLMKQHAAPLVLFGLCFLLFDVAVARRAGTRATISHAAAFTGAAALPYAVLCLDLALRGVFGGFWFWTVTYARQYASTIPVSGAWSSFVTALPYAVRWNLLLWILALAGLGALAFARGRRRTRVLVLGWLVASFLAVCPGFFFRNHYFIVMFPALGLLVGAAVEKIAGPPASLSSGRRALAAVLVLGAGLAVAIAGERDLLFVASPAEYARMRYGVNPFSESIEIARRIREDTFPGERVAVLGSEPQIFFLSRRRSAARYVYAYALVEPHPYASAMQEETIREIEAAEPKYVVLVDVAWSWLTRPQSEKRIFDWVQTFLPSRYDKVGLVEIFDDRPSEFTWGDEATRRTPRTKDRVWVLRRR